MAGPPYIAVVGASAPTAGQAEQAEAVGRALAQEGAIVITGGRGGIMAAASRGAAQAGGTTLGILPGIDRGEANEWVTIALATGLGELRNGLVARAGDAVIAVGGAYGTLSEVALALGAGTPVFGLGTWPIDGVVAVDSPEEAAREALRAAAARAPERRPRHAAARPERQPRRLS